MNIPCFNQKQKKFIFAWACEWIVQNNSKKPWLNLLVQERRELKLVRNTTKEVRAKCVKENYDWMIFASQDTRANGFLVKTYKPEHT